MHPTNVFCRRASKYRGVTIAIMLLLGGLLANTSIADEPSATLRQITRGPKNHFFGYVGHGLTIPWNASGRYIVALRVDFHDRMPRPGETADVVLIDTENDHRVEVVDRTHAWNLQQGTMLYWHPRAAEQQFFFNDLDPETGTVFTVLYDVSKRQRIREYRFGKLSIANGGVAPGGDYFAAINYGKISRSRSVISYAGAKDSTESGPANPTDDGVFRVDIATGEKKLLASYKQLADLILNTPKNRERLGDPDQYPIYAHHTLWCRSGERFIFIVRGKGNKRPDQACVIHVDGTGLATIPYGGHPEWFDERTLVLPSKEDGAYNLYDVVRREFKGQLGAEGVFPDTSDDNALSPDRKWYVGSQKSKLKPNECVYTLYRLAEGKWFRAPPVPTKAGGGDVRLDPAPRWNRTSDRLLVPGLATDGTVQLFVLDLNRGTPTPRTP